MSRSTRLFEIIQLLRAAARPLTAAQLAETLEVTPRTIYRDMAALQSMRVPVEGEAGIGYIMRPGYDLPPLMFSAEEVEAIVLGLTLLRRTGDHGLQRAARQVSAKIASVLPPDGTYGGSDGTLDHWPLYASGWTAVPKSKVNPQHLRQAIRSEQMVRLTYLDLKEQKTQRAVKPLAVLYYVDVVLLMAWCCLRKDFRHFRLDRIESCDTTGENFLGQGKALRQRWQMENHLP
ncbi:MAG: YafY family protein [Pseudomonadota bacterium]